ncbi:MAG: hypothetical protein B7X35_05190 [Halothiobacillus sp. 14-56-357]|jgi:hypothetical protein|nr:MAG: hypothetical protein B7X35_05190 [Halothiobacillus sp. 14-56-357]
MSRKARRETGLRQLNAKQAQARVNGYSIRERRNTAGLRQLRVKSPSKACPMRVAAQKPQHFVIGLGIVA